MTNHDKGTARRTRPENYLDLTKLGIQPFPAQGWAMLRGGKAMEFDQLSSWLNSTAHTLKNRDIRAGIPVDAERLTERLMAVAQKASGGWWKDPYDMPRKERSTTDLARLARNAVLWAIEHHDPEKMCDPKKRATLSKAGKAFVKVDWNGFQKTRRMGATAAARALGVTRDTIYKARKRWMAIIKERALSLAQTSYCAPAEPMLKHIQRTISTITPISMEAELRAILE